MPSVTACGPEKCQAGYNALQAASMSGQLESVQMLLEAMEFFGFRADGNVTTPSAGAGAVKELVVSLKQRATKTSWNKSA